MNRKPNIKITQAFGWDGGWGIERRVSRRAKARERAWIYRMGLKGRAIKAGKAPHSCAECRTPIPKNFDKRGPHAEFCSEKCYQRKYQRERSRRAAGLPVDAPDQRTRAGRLALGRAPLVRPGKRFGRNK